MTAINTEQSDSISNRIVALTRDLVMFPSSKNNPDEIRRLLEFIQNHLESLDQIEIRHYEFEGNPALVALPKNESEVELMLGGHIDVIEHPEDVEYHSVIEEGKIIGPGAGDMKGQVAILLDLFRELHLQHPGISLGLMITSDEEQGGEKGVRYLLEQVGLRCKEAIVPDGGSLNQISVEEKGIIHLRIESFGQSGHAARPWLLVNPFDELLMGIARLKDFFDVFKSRGHAGISNLSLIADSDFDHHWYPTCAVTMISTPNHQVNRIPSHASAVLDIRFTPEFTQDELLEIIQEKLGPEIKMEKIISANPSKLSPDPLFQKITEEITGEPVENIREDGGSDARFFCKYDIPVIVSRPNVGNLHGEDEWIDIESMEKWRQICKTFIERKLIGTSDSSFEI